MACAALRESLHSQEGIHGEADTVLVGMLRVIQVWDLSAQEAREGWELGLEERVLIRVPGSDPDTIQKDEKDSSHPSTGYPESIYVTVPHPFHCGDSRKKPIPEGEDEGVGPGEVEDRQNDNQEKLEDPKGFPRRRGETSGHLGVIPPDGGPW
jgi:hypothetical protein